MIARYEGKCAVCKGAIPKGSVMRHLGPRRNAHVECLTPRDPILPRQETPRDPIEPRKGKYNLHHIYRSWDHYVDTVEETGTPGEPFNGNGSTKPSEAFNGNTSLGEAIKFAREGWLEGIKKIRKISAPMMDKVGSRIERQDPFYTIEPGMIEFGRYFDGEPECCLELANTLVQGPGKFINILLNGTISWQLEEREINIRGAAILALIELLEYAGCRVQLTLLYHFRGHDHGSSMTDFILLKPYDQPLDYNRLSFTALHPAALRRLHFRMMEHYCLDDETKQTVFSVPGGYGSVQEPSSDTLKDYDIYFERLVPDTARFHDNDSCIAYITEELERQGVTLT